MKFLVLALISFFIFASTFGELMKDSEASKYYFNYLKKNYDKRIPPPGEKGSDSSIKVYLTMYILDISEVDDSSMDFTAQFFFRQSWNDSRLKFTPLSQYIILRDAEEIWTPDLFFVGGRESKIEQIVHPNMLLKIRSSGEVLYSLRLTVKFSCPMDLRYFPHDIQKCYMKIESYAHTTKTLDIEWLGKENSVGASKGITLHNFDLISVGQSEEVQNLTTGQYKILSVPMIFKRKFGYFATKLYAPFILLVILSMLSLWINAEERGIRLSFLLIIMYFMTHIENEVSLYIPPTPYTKGIDVWIGFCESLVFGVFIEFIAVALIVRRQCEEISDTKAEVSLNMESDKKEQSVKTDSLKSHLWKFLNTFEARNGGSVKRDASAYRVDKISRIVFPLTFILFSIVYYSVYCCKLAE